MIEITASGRRKRKDMTVHCIVADGVSTYLFNGQPDATLAEEIRRKLEWTAIGGTYYPETVPLQIVAVLASAFFDRSPDLHVSGDEPLETIPYKKGVIY